jgi:hypothetical protein
VTHYLGAMIRYDLQCDKGHEFDGWFSDSSAFDMQLEQKLIACAHCGSIKIEKQLMAPGIPTKANSRQASVGMAGGLMDPSAQKMLAMMREYRKAVEANAENVGDRFAEEARKIHYEETEKRGIYGQATREDAESLLAEGIEFHPLPALPEDKN